MHGAVLGRNQRSPVYWLGKPDGKRPWVSNHPSRRSPVPMVGGGDILSKKT
jgi:hypothetical protein